MRLAGFSLVLISALGLIDCKTTASTFSSQAEEQQKQRPAPILTPGMVNPPMVEARHTREGQPSATFRTIPVGTTIQIRNNDQISLRTAQPGESFAGVVARDVLDATGRLAIPHGSSATLIVLRAGVLNIGGVVVAGKRYGIEAPMRGDAGAQAERIPATTLLSFKLDDAAKLREIQ
jgi:hypothetical protein